MTPQQLRSVLIPVVTDHSLTKAERDNRLRDIAIVFFAETRSFDVWNSVMADIVKDFGLSQH